MRRYADFFYLYLFTMAGIFLHELGHHLLGVQSLLSLSRNWPLVGVTPENWVAAMVGTLSGPVVNLVLGYGGVALYRLNRRGVSLCLGLSNLFLVWSAALINLVVDWLSHSTGNDLEQVSALLGWHVLVLPAVFVALAIPGFRYLYAAWVAEGRRWSSAALVMFAAWLLGGATLMTLDAALHIRFSIR